MAANNRILPVANGPSCPAQPGPKLISICIPTFNRASYLEQAIESILPQLGSDTELLVYDTGSNDHTLDVMSEIARKSPEVRYFRRETRLGVDETLLLLLEESCGEYVWFFGSDDVLKEGAVQKVRQSILKTAEWPTLIYVNHEIVDIKGRLLTAFQVTSQVDREFREGWRAVPWLGMNLGYISSCIVRREKAREVRNACEFIGSHWVSLYLYLGSLLRGGSLQYLGQPLLEARRNPSACNQYGKIFVRQANRILCEARRQGYPWFAIFRTKDRIARTQYLRFVVAFRCDDQEELTRTFREIFRAYWMCPSFWLLLLPVRLTPRWLARAIRNRLRQWRERRNRRLESPLLTRPGARARQD